MVMVVAMHRSMTSLGGKVLTDANVGGAYRVRGIVTFHCHGLISFKYIIK